VSAQKKPTTADQPIPRDDLGDRTTHEIGTGPSRGFRAEVGDDYITAIADEEHGVLKISGMCAHVPLRTFEVPFEELLRVMRVTPR
jgi:hypothetical protein